MANELQISNFRTLKAVAKKLRRDLKLPRTKVAHGHPKSVVKENKFVLLFAHNGVGKTRLSTEFKDIAKRRGKRDTLYFNAFTEDLFDWNNDLKDDVDRRLRIKSESQFFDGIEGMGIEDQIRELLGRYADFYFDIRHADAEIRFSRDVIINGRSERVENIKISRGEENIFIWCFFLAIARLAIEAEKGQPYNWVKHIYIDDPISSLDEHHSIAVASDLARLLKSGKAGKKVVISTHHGLFFNVMFNELKSGKSLGDEQIKITKKAYIFQRSQSGKAYSLCDTGESPFLHHVSSLIELRGVAKSGEIYLHHFNMLRGVLEKTAIFFGCQHISTCFEGLKERELYSRMINVRSHAKYSIYDPKPLHLSERKLFKEILHAFIERYPFNRVFFPSMSVTPKS